MRFEGQRGEVKCEVKQLRTCGGHQRLSRAGPNAWLWEDDRSRGTHEKHVRATMGKEMGGVRSDGPKRDDFEDCGGMCYLDYCEAYLVSTKSRLGRNPAGP